MEMKNVNWKELFIDILVDIVAGMIIAVGIYNFALNADFPVAGFSGIAIILYHLFGLPVGAGTIILNVPVAIFCYKFLGKEFFLKSMKSMIISSLLMDYVAPLFPVYDGSRLLAALCICSRFSLVAAVTCHFSTPSVFSFWNRILKVRNISFISSTKL